MHFALIGRRRFKNAFGYCDRGSDYHPLSPLDSPASLTWRMWAEILISAAKRSLILKKIIEIWIWKDLSCQENIEWGPPRDRTWTKLQSNSANSENSPPVFDWFENNHEINKHILKINHDLFINSIKAFTDRYGWHHMAINFNTS